MTSETRFIRVFLKKRNCVAQAAHPVIETSWETNSGFLSAVLLEMLLEIAIIEEIIFRRWEYF